MLCYFSSVDRLWNLPGQIYAEGRSDVIVPVLGLGAKTVGINIEYISGFNNCSFFFWLTVATDLLPVAFILKSWLFPCITTWHYIKLKSLYVFWHGGLGVTSYLESTLTWYIIWKQYTCGQCINITSTMYTSESKYQLHSVHVHTCTVYIMYIWYTEVMSIAHLRIRGCSNNVFFSFI